MVTESGLVKVRDFGIAGVAGTEHLTTDGYMMGTPAYMAPEQVMGAKGEGRAYLYSMGVVLYRLLTANLPFKAETAIAMAQKQIKDPPTPLRQFRAELPSWCQDILDRALAKAPDDRFQTAEEFRAALTRITASGVNENVGSTAALATAATGVSGMDLTVPPNVMITPVGGVNTGAVVGELPETVLSASPAKPLPAQVPAPAPPRRTTTAGKTPLVLAAVGIVVFAAVVVAVVRSRRAPVETHVPTQVSATVDPAPSAPVVAPQTPSVETPPAPTPAPPVAVTPPAASAVAATKDTGQPSGATAGAKGSKAATKPTIDSAPVTPSAPSVEPPVPASSTIPASLPPVIFKPVDLLMVDAGKSKDREASLKVGDSAVEVLDGQDQLRHAAYDTIVGIYYSHSRDPRWVNPAGTVVPVVKADTGRFRLFRGGSDWLTVRTKTEFILLKVESSSIGKIIGALETRTGLKVVRVGERD
jgi:serine/threonine-protein kinase